MINKMNAGMFVILATVCAISASAGTKVTVDTANPKCGALCDRALPLP